MTEKEFELYLTKLEDCDQEYFNKLSVLEEVAFFTELQSYLRADAGLREDFADGLLAFFEQHERMKLVFVHETSLLGCKVKGIKEYMRKLPNFSMIAGDAGLIIKGISAGGTAFAYGAPTFFGDWKFRNQLLRTAEIASGTVKEKGKRHYRMAEMFLVVEATVLAMRTNIQR